MKRVWDSQEPGAGPTIDDSATLDRVQLEAEASERDTTVFEMGMTWIFSLVALITMTDAVLDQEPWYSYVSSAITFGIAAYVFVGRRHRLSERPGVESSFLGHVERGIASADYQICRTQTFVWWFVVPSLAPFALSAYYTLEDRPRWVWVAQPLGVILFYGAMQVNMRIFILPRKRTLESLREQLEA